MSGSRRANPGRPHARALAALLAALMLAGCVRRTITVTTDPPGALCWLNGAEVGRTPITVDFLHYGEYDVQLTKEGYEPLLTTGTANSPLWDTIPLDLAAELWPNESHADIRWHYVLQPRETNRPELIDRAEVLREQLLGPQTQPAGSPASAPDSGPVIETSPEAAPAIIETTGTPASGR